MLAFNKGLWRSTLAAALFCALCTWGSLSWIHADREQERQGQITAQTAVYLTSLFDLLGDWTQVIDRITSAESGNGLNPLSSDVIGGKLAIWSADNRLLWNSDGAGEDNNYRQVLLKDGQVIGFFTLQVEQNRMDMLVWLLPLLIAAAVFIAVYGVLSRMEERFLRFGRRIQQKLSAVDSLTEPEMAVGSQDQEVSREAFVSAKLQPLEVSLHQQIHELSDRLYRLETIRKSMVADIAHELRTPLAVMRAQLENALDKQLPLVPEQLHLLQDEIFRMSKLLGDLQQLALAESGHLAMKQSWFSLRQLLEEIRDAFELEAEESAIALTMEYTTAARIYADENRLRQVFVNLLGNALRYARSSIVVTVHLDDPSSSYRIKIADDGPGIEEEELSHIFERFYRGVKKSGNSPHEPVPTGLGLGLPIVKQLIEAHRGTIEVSSRWNEGTVFTIELPAFNDLNSQ